MNQVISKNKLAKLSKTRVRSFIIFLLAFALHEIGTRIYRPYIYENRISDFHIADTIGNFLGTVTSAFFVMALINADKKESRFFIIFYTFGLILYECLQPFIYGSTFDLFDIFATLLGGLSSFIILRTISK